MENNGNIDTITLSDEDWEKALKIKGGPEKDIIYGAEDIISGPPGTLSKADFEASDRYRRRTATHQDRSPSGLKMPAPKKVRVRRPKSRIPPFRPDPKTR